MITTRLKNEVLAEAAKLRQYATAEERSRLNNLLNPLDANRCIYGLMTGSCYSERANVLLRLCAVPYSVDLTEYIRPYREWSSGQSIRSFSAIEYYTAQFENPNLALIEYLRGDRNELKITDL